MFLLVVLVPRWRFPMLNTPVGLSVFNRPDLTELVFQAIGQARPKRVFVFADGPRSPDEAELCARARAVAKKVDWDCDVRYDFSEVNLGARRRYASGVDWVFSQVDEAIFLDDDCVPDPTFFPFCQAMLAHYRDDTRVMMVSGSNYLERWKEDRQSYHFSYFGSPWGWASWERAWKFYDVTMAAWGDEEIKARIRDLIADEEIFAFQARRFDRLYAEPGDRHSWDLPWSFARLMQGGLTVVPAVNLISNLGNTDGRGVPPAHPLANLRTAPLPSPLRLQSSVAVDRVYDKLHVRRIHEWFTEPAVGRDQISSAPRVPRIARALRRRLPRVYRIARTLRGRLAMWLRGSPPNLASRAQRLAEGGVRYLGIGRGQATLDGSVPSPRGQPPEIQHPDGKGP
jgi:hypothetical protein